MDNFLVRGREVGGRAAETFGKFETLEAAREWVAPRIAGYSDSPEADTAWAEIIDLDTNQIVEMHGDK